MREKIKKLPGETGSEGNPSGANKRLFDRECCSGENQLIHTAESGRIEGISKGGIAGGEFGGNILIAQLPEMTMIEVDILHMAIVPPGDHGHLGG